MVTEGIVLAAGRGSRLGPPPKPLQRVGGLPLIAHAVRRLAEAGIRRVVVVVGPEPEAVAAAACEGAAVEVVCVPNSRWEETANGMSLLAARAFVTGPCALAMADHLFAPGLVRRVIDHPRAGCVLGVDRDWKRCFDLEDATKVALAGERIVAIGKALRRYEALDTGMFRIAPELVDALAAVADARGDCSLSEGVQALADAGRMGAADIGTLAWLDVDTPAARDEAERLADRFGSAGPEVL